MAATKQSGLFATKPVGRLVEDTHEKEHELQPRCPRSTSRSSASA